MNPLDRLLDEVRKEKWSLRQILLVDRLVRIVEAQREELESCVEDRHYYGSNKRHAGCIRLCDHIAGVKEANEPTTR